MSDNNDHIDPPSLGFKQPSIAFEEAVNITGVAEKYKFPSSFTAEQFDERISAVIFSEEIPRKKKIEFLQDMFTSVIQLNTQLNGIGVDLKEAWQIQYCLFGMTSGYNTKDIEYFIKRSELKNAEEMYNEDGRIKREMFYLFKEYGIPKLPDGWIPCRQTYETVIRKIMPKLGDAAETFERRALKILERQVRPISKKGKLPEILR